MKFLSLSFLIFAFLLTACGKDGDNNDVAIIQSVDDSEHPANFLEASEEALPLEHYQQLLHQMSAFAFTVVPENTIRDLFEELEKNRRARYEVAGGGCAIRRAYIQSYLKKLNIVSGRMLIQCPGNRGRLRLKDQATGRRYSFANFHDANIVAVQTGRGLEYQILDLQFEDTPKSLHEFLGEVEYSQKLKPAKNKSPDSKGYCYWDVRTPSLTY